jgi:hypothetical protein
MSRTSSNLRQSAVAGLALLLLVDLCLATTLARQLCPGDQPVVAEVQDTPTVYGCRYHVVVVTPPPSDLLQPYWFWEYRRGSSAEGIYLWANRAGGSVRMGLQVTVPDLAVVSIPCL